MPTAVYKLFITYIKDAIHSQLKLICEGPGSAAHFTQKVHPARFTEIFFPANDTLPSIKSKHKPDTSF